MGQGFGTNNFTFSSITQSDCCNKEIVTNSGKKYCSECNIEILGEYDYRKYKELEAKAAAEFNLITQRQQQSINLTSYNGIIQASNTIPQGQSISNSASVGNWNGEI